MNLKNETNIILYFLLLLSFNSHAQNRDYKFVNDYIKYVEHKINTDTFNFKLDYRITKREKQRNLRSNKINHYLDSLGADFYVTDKQTSIKWKARRIDKKRTLNKFPKAKNDFVYIDYFTISKPIFYKDFVLIIDRGGTTCMHQTSAIKVLKWDEESGSISEIYSNVFGISSPCFR